MKNVLIGVNHSIGSFIDDSAGKRNAKKIEYDNIVLHFADFNHEGCIGFSIPKGSNPVKIKFEFFEDVVGVPPIEFLNNFKERYLYRCSRILSEVGDFGKVNVEYVPFGNKTCFERYKLEEELRAAEEEEKKLREEEDRKRREERRKSYGTFDDLDDISFSRLNTSGEPVTPDKLESDYELDKDTGELKKKK